MKEHIFLKSKNKSHILAVKQIKVKSGKKKKNFHAHFTVLQVKKSYLTMGFYCYRICSLSFSCIGYLKKMLLS